MFGKNCGGGGIWWIIIAIIIILLICGEDWFGCGCERAERC